MAAWVEEDSVGIIGLCDPDLDELLLTNERNHGWDNGTVYLRGVGRRFRGV